MSSDQSKKFSLEDNGIKGARKVYWDLSAPRLYEEAVRRNEGFIAADGPFIVHTGKYTGRSPNDKFIVKEPSSEDKVWWGKVNKSIEPAKFDALYAKVLQYLQGKDVFVQDCYAGC